MAYIIHIETSTTVCSVALAKDGELLSIHESDEQNSHAASLTLFIERSLEEAGISTKDLDAVAVSTGPGSYTGLRIGYSTAKGLCYALDIPMIGVSTLQALAYGAKKSHQDQKRFCPMIDARRMEVYCAVYDAELNEIEPVVAKVLNDESVVHLLNEQKTVFCGNGAFKVSEVTVSSEMLVEKTTCSAINMIKLAYKLYKNAIFEDIAYATPLYVKAPFITKPRKRL